MALRPFTVRAALLWLVALAVLPLVAGSAFILRQQWQAERSAADLQLLSLTDALVEAVDRELSGHTAQLEAVAASAYIDERDWSALHRFAGAVVRNRPGFLISLLGPDGQVLVNSAVALGTPLPNVWRMQSEHRTAQWLGRTLPMSSQGLTRRVLEQGETAYSHLYFGVNIQRPTLAVSVPVRRGGSVAYALTLSFPPDSLQALVERSNVPPGMRVLVADADRRVVASNASSSYRMADLLLPPTADELEDRAYELVGRDGIALVGAMGRSSLSGFTVRVAMPREHAYAAARRTATAWGLFLLMMLAATLTLIGQVSRRLVLPLAQLARQARTPETLLTGGHAQVDEALQSGPARSGIVEIDIVQEALGQGRRAIELQRADAERRLRAEQAAQAAEQATQRIRQVLDQLFAFVGILRPDGTLIEANAPPLALIDARREDVLDQPFWEAPWWRGDAHRVAQLQQAVARAAAGERVRYDVVIEAGRGQRITIDFQIAPLADTPGSLLIANGVDVTQRVQAFDSLQRSRAQALQSEERLRALAENIDQMAWIADAQGQVHWMNRRWEDLTDRQLRTPPSLDWAELHLPQHRERVLRKAREHLAAGTAWEDTFPLRRRDGELRWFLSRTRPVRDAQDELSRWVGTLTDVTEQQLIEHALRESQDRLIAREALLREADRQKDRFLATLAHELRNPLAPIRTAVHIIRQRPVSDPLVGQAAATIDRQSAQLARLVDDLLEVSRITLGSVNLQRNRVDLRHTLELALETSRPLIEQAGHHFRLRMPDEPLPAQVDETRIAQAVANVLNNACKFTPPGGCIELAVERESDDQVCIRVTDSGEGVAADMLDSVFDLFVQEGRSGQGGNSGLGIGLALTRGLVQQHGGSVRLTSPGKGQGSCCEIRLPLDPSAHSPGAVPGSSVAATAVASKATSQAQVLVVDDNEDAAQSLCALLGLAGYSCATAIDGGTALQMQSRLQARVLILDIGLPDMTGYELARRLREQSADGHGLLLIAVTGWGQDADRALALAAGFDHHFTKPVDPAALLAAIEMQPA